MQWVATALDGQKIRSKGSQIVFYKKLGKDDRPIVNQSAPKSVAFGCSGQFYLSVNGDRVV